MIVVAVLVVFGRLLACDFLDWDDEHTVHHNDNLNPEVTWRGLRNHWTGPTASIYIPLTYTAWAAIALIARVAPDDQGISLNPLWFHAANLLVHAAASLLAFQLLNRLLRQTLAALVGALLFALHPVQVESVAWISGLKDVLAGCLMLGSMTLYCRDAKTTRAARARYLGAVVLFALAMLSKPSAMMTPLLLFAIDRLALQRPLRQSVLRLAPFVVLAIPIAIVARVVQIAPAPPPPVWIRPLVALDSVSFYVAKVIAPLTLTIDYGRQPAMVINSGAIWWTWLGIAITAAILFWLSRRWRTPLVWCAGALFVVAPLPVLGLVPFDYQEKSTVADHYLYVAMLGPALLLGLIVLRRPRLAKVAFVVLAVFGVRSMLQTPVWQDETSLMSHAIDVNPRSFSGHLNLAKQLGRRGEVEGERRHIRAAYAINPDDPSGLRAMADLAIRDGDFATADRHWRHACAMFDKVYGVGHKSTAWPRTSAALMFLAAGRLEEARRYGEEARRIDPDSSDAAVLKFLQSQPPTSAPAQP